jgi:hypothetical protein
MERRFSSFYINGTFLLVARVKLTQSLKVVRAQGSACVAHQAAYEIAALITITQPCDHLICFPVDMVHLMNLVALLDFVSLVDTQLIDPKPSRLFAKP